VKKALFVDNFVKVTVFYHQNYHHSIFL